MMEKARNLTPLQAVNEIRNKVMHPARGIDPNEEDFAFIRSVNRDLRV